MSSPSPKYVKVYWPDHYRYVEPDSTTFCHVLRFASEMEHKLALNRHKGDREGWLTCDPNHLLSLLKIELGELEAQLGRSWGKNSDDIIAEAADVGNFAMMIADIARTLQAVKGPGEFERPEATNPALVVEPKSELPGNVKFEPSDCPHEWVYIGYQMTRRHELAGLLTFPEVKTIIERCTHCHKERIVRDYPPFFPTPEELVQLNVANDQRPVTAPVPTSPAPEIKPSGRWAALKDRFMRGLE